MTALADLQPELLTESETRDLYRAYLESQPDGLATEDELVRWISDTQELLIHLALVIGVLRRQFLVSWSDEEQDFLYSLRDRKGGSPSR